MGDGCLQLGQGFCSYDDIVVDDVELAPDALYSKPVLERDRELDLGYCDVLNSWHHTQ